MKDRRKPEYLEKIPDNELKKRRKTSLIVCLVLQPGSVQGPA